MENENELKELLKNSIIEKPAPFYLKGRLFYLYPPTLGKNIIMSGIIEGLGVDAVSLAKSPTLEALRLSAQKPEDVAYIIAYSTTRTREECEDHNHINELADFFKECDNEDRATLLSFILTSDRVAELRAFLGLDKEYENMAKCARAKKDGSTLTFCAKSIYGQTIDNACKRYGWTFDYVVWGISYTALQMLLADYPKDVYMTEDERKRAGVGQKREIVDAAALSEDEIKNILNIK